MLLKFFISILLHFVSCNASEAVHFSDGLSLQPDQLKIYCRKILSMEKVYDVQEYAQGNSNRIIVMFGNKSKDMGRSSNVSRNGYINLDECIHVPAQSITDNFFDSQDIVSLLNKADESNKEYIILGYKEGGICAAKFARKLLDAISKKVKSAEWRNNNNTVKLYGIYPSPLGGVSEIDADFRSKLAYDMGAFNCSYFVPPTFRQKYGYNYPGLALDIISYEYYQDNYAAVALSLVNVGALIASIYYSVGTSAYMAIPWGIFAVGSCSSFFIEPQITPETIELVYNSVKGRKENRHVDKIADLGKVSLLSIDRGFLKVVYDFLTC